VKAGGHAECTSECGEKNMSSDKFQRQIDFILEQQAKFDAELAVGGKETDARLYSLIEVVERYFGNGQQR
jgi:hypothetical protein